MDWYIRLEQGRAVNPSNATLDALAVALQLDAAEHRHLVALARPTTRAKFVRELVPDSMCEMLSTLGQPAYVVGRRFDVLAWNNAATELLTDFALLDEQDRNTVSIIMTHPSAKQAFGTGWRTEAQRVVARFRAAYDLYDGDPAFIDLVGRLSTTSPVFREWWAKHDVGTSTSGLKTIWSSRRAPQTWAHHSFQSNDNPDLRLVIYSRQASQTDRTPRPGPDGVAERTPPEAG